MTGVTSVERHAVSRGLLAGSGVEHGHVVRLVRAALAEDLAWGPDLTTEATIPSAARGTAHVVARAPGPVAGLGVAAAVIEVLAAGEALRAGEVPGVGDPGVGEPRVSGHAEVEALVGDGARVAPGDRLMRVSGPLRVLLTGERTLLNLLCQLSGVATETARWVEALGTGADSRPRASVRDTRKTVPGLRVLQKYAVRCGGGVNHRMGLGDAALIKDNHVAAAGSITAAFRAVRERYPTVSVEVECDTTAQVAEALAVGAELILLDNMDGDEMRAAVALAQTYAVKLEASGGLSLDRAAEVAATGVDYVAIGALTHSAPALDLGLDLDAAER